MLGCQKIKAIWIKKKFYSKFQHSFIMFPCGFIPIFSMLWEEEVRKNFELCFLLLSSIKFSFSFFPNRIMENKFFFFFFIFSILFFSLTFSQIEQSPSVKKKKKMEKSVILFILFYFANFNVFQFNSNFQKLCVLLKVFFFPSEIKLEKKKKEKQSRTIFASSYWTAEDVLYSFIYWKDSVLILFPILIFVLYNSIFS